MLEAFFFVIGGIQPKVKVLDERPVRCPACGLHQARTQRIDHYLSLFFIPLIRVRTGEPFLVCDRCRQTAPESGPEAPRPFEGPSKRCRSCNRDMPPDYSFCPQCGRRL